MKYAQRNPIPLPDGGPLERVASAFESTFDWKYGLEKESLLSLYEKGKARTWNATDVDWSIDVDIERMAHDRVAMGSHEVMNTLLDPPRPLGAEESVRMQLEINAWMISQFLHGEQGALLATAKIVMAAPDE